MIACIAVAGIGQAGTRGAHIPSWGKIPVEVGTSWSDSVTYKAKQGDYRVDKGIFVLSGDAMVTYRDMTLKAERITFYVEQDFVVAEGVPDTVKGEWIGLPVFVEGDSDPLKGTRMIYNLKTRRGRVFQGRTTFEKGVYFGEEIAAIGENTLKVSRGTYTTCDKKPPHYHFYGRRMKLLVNDKVIVKPVVFYVADIPMMWLPFAIFPIKRGRHSGLLTPRYGSSRLEGRYIRNIGYYYAPNDYWDGTLRTSFFEKAGWMLETDLRYALRYRFNGSIHGSFKDEIREGKHKGRRWDLRIRHAHTFDPTFTLRASGHFVSDRDYLRDTSWNSMYRMNRTLRSDLVVHKRWTDSGNSFSFTVSHSKSLDTSESTLSLPRISFRKPQRPLFPIKNKKSRTQSDAHGLRGTPKSGLHAIYYSAQFNFSNQFRRRKDVASGTFKRLRSAQAYGGLSLSSSQKLFGWLNLSPSLGWNERWDRSEQGAYSRSEELKSTARLNTTFYGLFKPHIGPLKAIRHVLEPSLSARYQRTWKHIGGTYGFGGEAQKTKPQRSISIRVGNLLQMKTQHGEKERKFDLGNLTWSTGYDFERTQRKWSDLRTTLSIKPTRNVDVRLNTQHALYNQDDRLDLWRPDLKSLTLSTSLRLSGKPGGGTSQKRSLEPEREEDIGMKRLMGYEEPPDGDEVPGVRRQGIYRERSSGPWRLSLSHRYSLSKWGTTSRKTSWVRGSLGFNPTRNWRVNYSFNYDLRKKRMTAQNVSIYRDLHCWEARIQWTPSGYREGYYFLMNIKALPEIKIEQRRGTALSYTPRM